MTRVRLRITPPGNMIGLAMWKWQPLHLVLYLPYYPPDLCKVIYASGKFNKFIPAYFWKVGNSPEYKSYGLINNCKEFWDKEVDEMEMAKLLPIIPAYTSSELLAMLPKTVTPMGGWQSTTLPRLPIHTGIIGNTLLVILGTPHP